MTQSSNTTPQLEAVFDGVPVVVRLLSQDDIICVLYQRPDDDDGVMLMERPLRLIMDEIATEPREKDRSLHVSYSKVRMRFDRWMPMTSATMFPIYTDHVLSIAPVADQFINPYMEWANQLYDVMSDPTHSPDDNATADELRKSYFDFLLLNFHPKGKPS